MTGKPLILSNVDVGDDVFESLSHGNWNVTRALRDCVAGKHKMYEFDVAEVMAAAADTEFDPAKVDSMVADPARLQKSPGLIFVVLGKTLWLIDGIHRLRALHRLGFSTGKMYVIEERDSARYRVYYNGDPVAPWQKKKGRS